MIRPPCGRNCPDRFVKLDENGKAITCHSTCKEWADYERLKEGERQIRRMENLVISYQTTAKDRMKKVSHYYNDRK